jgi:hypothetical protein
MYSHWYRPDVTQCQRVSYRLIYRGADKSLDRSGRKQGTSTEDFESHISYI